MAKIRLQTRYTLLCYIIQFTAAGFEGHVGHGQPVLRLRQGIQVGTADKVAGIGRIVPAGAKRVQLFKFAFFHGLHTKFFFR